MASFFVIRGKDNGQHFAVRGNVASIGRESSNQIKLNDTEVSRQHATITRTESDEFEIKDMGSSNGTFVNSKRIASKVLHSGDRVQVGRTLMIFTGGPDPHSSRSNAGVEIVNPAQGSEQPHIRRAVESQLGAFSVLPDGNLQASGPTPEYESSEGLSPVNDWEIVYQVSQAINRTVDLGELLTQVLDLIFQWIECDRGCIMMLDDVTGQLTPTYSRQRRQRANEAARPELPRKLQISRTILDYVTSNKEGVLTSNAQDDSRWQSVESINSLGVNEAICVPMLGRYGLVGAIYIDTQVSAGDYAERQGKPCFEEPHLKLMIAIGGQAALAIEDTQFYRAMLQSERLAAMGQTIANLSHHVKNILQGVSGGTYLVEDGLKKQDIEVIRRGWSIVEKNQERISNLVMDMLSFSKEREPELARNDVFLLLKDVYELMQARATELGVDLTLHPAPMLVEAKYDSEAMHRALLNVVTNAIDATAAAEHPPGSVPCVELSVEHQREKGLVAISVKDNGEGISEEDQLRIFAPFESNKGARGTGLGLPVSQKVLREHGGDITICSEVSKGSTFTLRWPDGDSPPARPAQVESNAKTVYE